MNRESRWPIVGLTAGAAALVAAFLLAPAALLRGSHPRYAEHSNLIADVDTSLDAFWRSGSRDVTGSLAGLVDYWFQWHAIKIVISALLVTVLGVLAGLLWRRWLASGAAGYVVAAMSATILGLLSIFVLIANVQSTAVPLVALLPMVSSANPDPALAQTLTDISQAAKSGADSPPLLTLMDNVTRYHWVMIAMATPLCVVFGAASIVALRRCRIANTVARPHRLMYRLLGGIAVVMTLALLFLLVAAVVAVVDPSTALLDVLGV
ncbi:hypothetical protein [Rhodococcus sp. P1Y]|uniref:hypothetical protein n=1 Tax=Rhodococcus sp. P1Y TaxID=1302308 RepID=UPI000EB4CD63|nr:hypothetical protein [Rhodococcus sp. P1Y]AYJ48053.1 hypothetical protein D8W71_06585 [Rhodococcus sp. P1Y]